jgi:hypothetical protein
LFCFVSLSSIVKIYVCTPILLTMNVVFLWKWLKSRERLRQQIPKINSAIHWSSMLFTERKCWLSQFFTALQSFSQKDDIRCNSYLRPRNVLYRCKGIVVLVFHGSSITF